MSKIVPIGLLGAAAVAIPVGAAVAMHMPTGNNVGVTQAQGAAAKPTATPKPKKTPAAKKARPVTARTYVGPSEDMQWGPVQVTIVVKGSVVTDLSATAPTERARSAFINSQAIPMLRQEVLQAKTAAGIKNIYGISGATMTSEAFYQSLLSALALAHLS
jgi:uncharacterized protein with FMN-binding domain